MKTLLWMALSFLLSAMKDFQLSNEVGFLDNITVSALLEVKQIQLAFVVAYPCMDSSF